jgi:hypothetical protein
MDAGLGSVGASPDQWYVHTNTYMPKVPNLHNLQLNHRSSASVQKRLAEPPTDKIEIRCEAKGDQPKVTVKLRVLMSLPTPRLRR